MQWRTHAKRVRRGYNVSENGCYKCGKDMVDCRRHGLGKTYSSRCVLADTWLCSPPHNLCPVPRTKAPSSWLEMHT
jgi:hypothetical protein